MSRVPITTRPQSGKKGKIFSILVNKNMGIGPLPDAEAIEDDLLTEPMTKDCYVISGDLIAAWRSITQGEGPIEWGICHSDLTSPELEQYLNLQDFPDYDDIGEQEVRLRGKFVRRLGMFANVSNSADEITNDGNYSRYKIRMRVGETHDLHMWVHNRSGATLTTGSNLYITGKLYCKLIGG